MEGYIYRHWIVNDKGEEKSYIGQTIHTLDIRWKKDGKGYLDHNDDTKFARAIKKYGWENFSHEIIGVVEADTKEQLIKDLDEWEKYYIWKYDSFHNGYNSTTGGGNGSPCEETRQKMRNNHYDCSGEKNPMYGKKYTNKEKQKHSDIMYTYYETEKGKTTRQKMSENHVDVKGSKNPNYGKGKKVICLNTKQIFINGRAANEWYMKTTGRKTINPTINACCQGKAKSAGKHPETNEPLKWMFYSDYLEQFNKNNSNPTNNKIA